MYVFYVQRKFEQMGLIFEPEFINYGTLTFSKQNLYNIGQIRFNSLWREIFPVAIQVEIVQIGLLTAAECVLWPIQIYMSVGRFGGANVVKYFWSFKFHKHMKYYLLICQRRAVSWVNTTTR